MRQRHRSLSLLAAAVAFPLAVATASLDPPRDRWGLAIPEDVPVEYHPELPLPPDPGPVVYPGPGDHVLQSNTRYVLTADVGRLHVPPGSSRVVVDAEGWKIDDFRTPVLFENTATEPLVEDIVLRDAELTGVNYEQSGIHFYARRGLIQNCWCKARNIFRYGIWTWGAEHVTLRDCDFRTQGAEAPSRFVSSSHVASYRNTFRATRIPKHCQRVHGESEYVSLVGNTCNTPWFLGYSDPSVAREERIDHLLVARCSVQSPSSQGSWFQHLAPGRGDLTNLTFIDNHGPATDLAQHQLEGLLEHADSEPTWSVSGNVADL